MIVSARSSGAGGTSSTAAGAAAASGAAGPGSFPAEGSGRRRLRGRRGRFRRGILRAAAEASGAAARGEAGEPMRWLFSNPVSVDHSRVVAAIAEAERKTSGRIRVLIARHRTKVPVAAAQRHFDQMGLSKAPERNGVLIFLAPGPGTLRSSATRASTTGAARRSGGSSSPR